MKSNDKSLPLPVLLKSMTEELHIADLPEDCSNTEVQAVRKGPPAKRIVAAFYSSFISIKYGRHTIYGKLNH